MGMDTVELVFRVEQEFDVKIAEGVAGNLHTVRELALYVFGLIQARRERVDEHMESRREEVLRLVMDAIETGLGGAARLQDPVRTVLPRRVRRRFWRKAEVSLPSLEMPVWARWVFAIGLFGGIAAFLLVFVLVLNVGLGTGVVFTSALGVVWGMVLYNLLSPVRLEIPREISTFGDLVRESLRAELRRQKWSSERPTFADVLLRVRELTAEQAGFALEEVKPESRFIKDLELA